MTLALKLLKVLFSGTTLDWNSNVATIKDGAFSAVVKK